MTDRSRGSNKAKTSRESILAAATNLLWVLHPAMQRMPKIERIEGAPVEMKRAATNIVRWFSVGKECQEVRPEMIHRILGEFGVLLAEFDIAIRQGLFTDREKLDIARQLERIEEGVRRWRTATRTTQKSQERQQGGADTANGAPAPGTLASGCRQQ